MVLNDPYSHNTYYYNAGRYTNIAELGANHSHDTTGSSELKANSYSRDTTPYIGASGNSIPESGVNNPRFDAQDLPVNYPETSSVGAESRK